MPPENYRSRGFYAPPAESEPKIKPPTEAQYQRAKIARMECFCPDIVPCQKCGWPVVSGYCCTTCGDTNPQEA